MNLDENSGAILFDSVVEKKQVELLAHLENKLKVVNSPNLPTFKERIQSVAGDVPTFEERLQPTNTSLDIPTLEDRLRGIRKQQVTQPAPFLSDKAQTSGLAYAANIPGSLLAGFGQLDNTLLSAPNHVLEALDNFGITSKTNKFMKVNYPEARTALQALDELGNVIEQGTSYFANSRETEILVDKVSAAYDDNSGSVNVAVSIITTVAANPEAIPEVVAQSLPMMLALTEKGSIFAATFTGMTGQRIDESVATWKETHNGQAPEGEDYNIIAMGAVVATAIETVESRFVLSKHSKIARAASEKLARLRGIPGINAGINAIEGAAAEAFEEGSAEYISQLTGRGDFSFTGLTSKEALRPSFVNAAIGAGPGAVIKGGTQVLPDTGKVAKTAVNATAAGVEKLVTVNTDKRLKNAEESGDLLKVVEIGLEKDITRFETPEERQEHVATLVKQLDEAAEQIEGTPTTAEEAKIVNDKINTLSTKLTAVLIANRDLKRKEAGELTTLAAEQVIQDKTSLSEQITKAIETVVNDVQEGVNVQLATITSIKGSAEFDSLTDPQKAVLNLFEAAVEAGNEARKIAGPKTIQDVAKDIQSGNKKQRFIGTDQQRKIVAEAIELKDESKAGKSLSQLVALRQALLTKLKNPPVNNKTDTVFTKHSTNFVNQLSAEIKSISATLALLNSNVTKAFGKSPLTADQVTQPEIELFSAARAEKVTKPKEVKETNITKTNALVETIRKARQNIADINSTIESKLNGFPTERQLNAIANWERAITKAKEELTALGFDLKTLNKNINTVSFSKLVDKAKQIIAAWVLPDNRKAIYALQDKLRITVQNFYNEQGEVIRKRANLAVGARYVVIKDNDISKNFLYDIQEEKVLKVQKQGFDGITEFIEIDEDAVAKPLDITPGPEAPPAITDVDPQQEELDSEVRAEEDRKEELIRDSQDTEMQRLHALGIDPDEDIDSPTSILNIAIPAKGLYNVSELSKPIVIGRTTRKDKEGKPLSFKKQLIEFDNILRAIQQIMRECM